VRLRVESAPGTVFSVGGGEGHEFLPVDLKSQLTSGLELHGRFRVCDLSPGKKGLRGKTKASKKTKASAEGLKPICIESWSKDMN
jgi:hypothetical protein